MQIDPWILAFSALTVIATVWMGFWSAKRSRTAGDFFVAGRSVSVGWNASAISGEYLSAASFMGVAGMVMSSGYDALWYPVCYACGYLFLLLFIAGPLRRFGAYTIPDFAEGRFDSPLFRKIAVVFVLFIGFFYTMPQMKGAGTTLAYIFPGLPYWAGVVLVGAVITLNVALGGMKGITLVQAFQYWLKMFAISVPIFALMAVYGHYGKQLNQNSSGAGLKLVRDHGPAKTNRNVFETLQRHLETEYAVKVPLSFADTDYARSSIFPDKAVYFEVTFPFDQTPTAAEFLILTNPPAYGPSELQERYERVWLGRGFGVLKGYKEVVIVATNRLPELQTIFDSSGLVGLTMPGSRSDLRKLPSEKAPADSTWLNPFGPLTTKAAKAAAHQQ